MGTMKVVDVINRANTILNDTTKVRWPEQELLDWYNDAQRAIVNRRPDANATNETFNCVLGSLQSLPAGALRLLDVTRNETLGTAITKIDRSILDQQYRNWHDPSSPVTDVLHFTYDDRDPKNFHLFPVPALNHQVRIVYSTALADVVIANFATDVQTIELDDTYINPLIDFILYRAYSKDAEYTQNKARADSAYATFRSGLGEKTQVDAAVSPNA